MRHGTCGLGGRRGNHGGDLLYAPLTEEETIAYGSLKYYGYTAKLYYKGEPMDCHASPPVLFLLEQMNQSSPSGMPEIYDGGLLPPVEASPVSDSYDSLLPP
ncbi:hypothetical protein ABFY27_10735 [Akkermansia massiliensis]